MKRLLKFMFVGGVALTVCIVCTGTIGSMLLGTRINWHNVLLTMPWMFIMGTMLGALSSVRP